LNYTRLTTLDKLWGELRGLVCTKSSPPWTKSKISGFLWSALDGLIWSVSLPDFCTWAPGTLHAETFPLNEGVHIGDATVWLARASGYLEALTLLVALCMRASAAGDIIWKLTPFVKSTCCSCNPNELLGRVTEALSTAFWADVLGPMLMTLEGRFKGGAAPGPSSDANFLLLLGCNNFSW